MTFNRRQMLQLTGATLASTAVPGFATAQTYPARPVRLLVGNAAGGGPDISARLMTQWLTDRLGQPFVVENRPGAGGNLATETVVNAPADGYTLLLVMLSNAVNVSLYAKLPFDFMHDIAPVASINRDALFMLVPQSFPAKTVPEFIAHAKANPGKLCLASPGAGTAPHIAGEMFKMMAGIDMVHVPYRGGGQALTDLIAGQVHVYFGGLPVSIEHIKAGRLRALAMTGATRSDAMPDVPTMKDFLPGYEASNWFGIGAPRGTPAEIITTLNKEINAALADPELKSRFAALGSTPFIGSADDFRRHIASEVEKWAKVVQFAGIKA